jgi:branched-chain amino acid transport system substrate-binding protein
VGSRLKCLSLSVPLSELPPRPGLLQSYAGETPDPYAIYGYESMQRSETGEKADILKALFATKDRKGVLGTYSIDENGDTTLTDRSLDTVEDGRLTFVKVVKGKGP